MQHWLFLKSQMFIGDALKLLIDTEAFLATLEAKRKGIDVYQREQIKKLRKEITKTVMAFAEIEPEE